MSQLYWQPAKINTQNEIPPEQSKVIINLKNEDFDSLISYVV